MLLLQIEGGEENRSLEFQDRPLLVGSDRSCEVLLPGGEAAPRQAALRPSGRNSWQVKALAPGITLNGRPFQSALLKEGDRLQVGPFVVTVREIRPEVRVAGEGRPRRRGRKRSFASALPWVLLLAGLAAATWGYFRFGGSGPLDVDVVRVVGRLDSWKLDEAARLLAEMKEKGKNDQVERLSRELEARRKAWAEADRIYQPIWARRGTMPEGKMVEALREALGRAEAEGRRLLAEALRWRLSNLSEALLASLGDPSGKRAARLLEGRKAWIATAEVVDRVDGLIAEDRFKAALQLLDQARAEASSPEAAEDYAAKKEAVLSLLKKKAWKALSRAYALANGGAADEAVRLLRETLAVLPPDPALARLKWKLKGAEYEILPLASGLEDEAAGKEKPEKGKPAEKPLDWGKITDERKKAGDVRHQGEVRPPEVPAPAKPSSPALSPAELAKEADKALRALRFARAAELFEKAASRDSGAARKALLARAEADFLDALIEAVRRRPAAFKGVRVEDGGRADFLSADRDGVDVVLDGIRDRIPWTLVGPAALVRLGARLHLSPRARLGRALLAEKAGMKKIFASSLAEALRGDPSLDPAVQALLARVTGKEGPFTWFEGEWIPVSEKAALLKTREAEKEARRALASTDRTAAAAALEKLADRGVLERKAVLRVLRERIDACVKKLSADPFFGKLERIAALRQELDKRRKRALELIFDEKKYFFPFKPPACPPEKAKKYWPVQAEVDRRVAAVREIWDKKESLRIPSQVRRLAEDALWALRELENLGSLDFGAEEALEFVRRLPLKEGVVTVRNFAWTSRERRKLDYDRRVLRYNQVADVDATKVEMEQMEITNAYRVMMGRRALAVNQKLLTAARKHSKEMADLGYFSHFSPTKGLRTPFMRMAKEGYTRGVSENIALVGGPEGAHIAWLHSSGHHRNILNPGHTEFATGNCGRYWTQCFGQGDEFSKDPLFEKE